MIKFAGQPTGEAMARVLQKARSYERMLMLFSVTAAYPVVIFISISWDMTGFIWYYPIVYLAGLGAIMLPKSAKEKAAITPTEISISEEYLLCVTSKGEQQRNLRDVKEVQDCKTYYEIVFRFGKLSPCFICQKDLLTEGTLEEFEELFKDKLTDLTDYFE